MIIVNESCQIKGERITYRSDDSTSDRVVRGAGVDSQSAKAALGGVSVLGRSHCEVRLD